LQVANLGCSYNEHTQEIRSIDWSFDQKHIASAGKDTTVHIWNSSTGKQKFLYKEHKQGTTHAIWLP